MKKMKKNMQTIRDNAWVSICVAILCVAAVVVAVLLLHQPKAETVPTEREEPTPTAMEAEPVNETVAPERADASPVPPAPTALPEETPAQTPDVSPTAMPAITPPASSAPPSSSSDIALYPVDPPAEIQLD